MTSINAIKQGLAQYLDTELMPLIPASASGKKFATGVIFSIFIKKLDNIAVTIGNKYMLADTGIIANDSIDIELLKDVITSNIPAEGISLSIPMLGEMTIKREDINKLYNTIKNYDKETVT